MAVKIVCSWIALGRLATERGKAFVRYKQSPIEENKRAFDQAEASLREYEKMCLLADEMIHLPLGGE